MDLDLLLALHGRRWYAGTVTGLSPENIGHFGICNVVLYNILVPGPVSTLLYQGSVACLRTDLLQILDE